MGQWVGTKGWLYLNSGGQWPVEEGHAFVSRFPYNGTPGNIRDAGVGILQLLASKPYQLGEMIHTWMSHLQTSETSEPTRVREATALATP